MQWIKIEDQLPPLHKQVLFCSEDKEFVIDYVSFRKTNGKPSYAVFPFMDYTHWMHLPEPPEEELKCPLCQGNAKLVKRKYDQKRIECEKCFLELYGLAKD